MLIQFPIAIVNGEDLSFFIISGTTAFTGPDGTQHPAECWHLWSEEDFHTMCPGWSILPVIDLPPTDHTKKHIKNGAAEWEITDSAVLVTYTSEDFSADEAVRIEAEVVAKRAKRVQDWMDSKVRERGYENIATCVTYADEPAVPKFQAEGQAARAWRSLVWATCYELLDEIKNGARDPLTNEELIAELPSLTWPD